ncbi:hypothetical protein GcM3_00098 [Golovinomyces cichoracearum]|uniref:Uncharacterized protein n=1 Tax=Golovinomyces cichoracearum TaxID=62708 RepID=A0A420HJ47_9PEZI|nr:hypothetical protein GcM3_00098 [Golovinomyces cichoracearum]
MLSLQYIDYIPTNPSLALLIILYLSYTPLSISSSLKDSCPIAEQKPCGSGLPLDFCCSAGEVCMSLAGNTTALCCPAGEDCSAILPINCDIQRQNITAFPNTPVKTKALDSSMMQCGSLCCPFGFICNSAKNCVEYADQTILPNMSFPLSLPPVPISSPKSSPPSMGNSMLMPVSKKFGSQFYLLAILVGFFPGLIVGIVLSIAIYHFRKNRKQKKRHQRHSINTTGYISAPQITVDMRADFLRKYITRNTRTPTSPAPSTKLSSFPSVTSIFRRTPSTSLDENDSDFDEMLKTPLPPVPLNIRKSNTTGSENRLFLHRRPKSQRRFFKQISRKKELVFRSFLNDSIEENFCNLFTISSIDKESNLKFYI